MIEIKHKDFVIEIEKASNKIKNSLLYCSVVHSKEGWYLFDDAIENNISEQIKEFKNLIDSYLQNKESWDFERMKPLK